MSEAVLENDFKKYKNNAFFKDLKKEVYAYLKENKIPEKRPWMMALNALFLFSLWGILYYLFLTLGATSTLYAIVLSVAWSAVMLAIQMGVMHDGSHGATSDNSLVNLIFMSPISLLGGSAILWKKQHCQAHHSFTNTHKLDHDIHTGGILRLHPSQPLLDYQKYQHIYAWFLYPLFVLSWLWWGDFRDLRDNTYSMTKGQLKNAMIESIIIKIWHVAVFIVLPIYMLNSFWLAIACYLISFSLLGIVMVVTFQLAHISGCQKLPETKDSLCDDWAVRQILTTANFATNNRFLTWIVGGLNYQVEHHIFPTMSSINYPKIQKIVEARCKKEGIPYLNFPTLTETIKCHQKHLVDFGHQLHPTI